MNRKTPGTDQPSVTWAVFSSSWRRPLLIGGLIACLAGSPAAAQAQERIDPAPFLKTLQEDPDDRNALLQMGLYYTMEKNYGKAVETYFRLLKVDPNNFHAYNNLGIIYKKVGQLKDSLHCYGQAMKLDPSNPWVPYNMGLAYESMGRMQEARESYGKALSLNPDFSQALQRLRDLSGSEQTAPLPPPTSILVAGGSDNAPRVLNAGDLGKPAEPPTTARVVADTAVKPVATPAAKPADAARKTDDAGKKPPAKASESPGPMVRTIRGGAGAPLYNKAMDALEKDDLNAAIENYILCILKDRDFLAEPDNGLIGKALELLKDRPNSLGDGLFYRGYLYSINGNLDEAEKDMQSYMSRGNKAPFFFEAKDLIDEFERRREAAKQAAAKAAEKAAMASLSAFLEKPETATFTPRPKDVVLKEMDVEQIIDEAKKFSRDTRFTDALAVLRVGMEKAPDNPQLLVAAANIYTDLFLSKNDREAGKMARDLFTKVASLVPPDSKEGKLAQSMLQELAPRLQ